MKDDLKPETLATLNSYSLRSDFSPRVVYSVISPDPSEDYFESVKWRDAVDFLIQDQELSDSLRSDYNETLDGTKFCEEEYDDYVWEHIETKATEMGYKIFTGVK